MGSGAALPIHWASGCAEKLIGRYPAFNWSMSVRSLHTPHDAQHGATCECSPRRPTSLFDTTHDALRCLRVPTTAPHTPLSCEFSPRRHRPSPHRPSPHRRPPRCPPRRPPETAPMVWVPLARPRTTRRAISPEGALGAVAGARRRGQWAGLWNGRRLDRRLRLSSAQLRLQGRGSGEEKGTPC